MNKKTRNKQKRETEQKIYKKQKKTKNGTRKKKQAIINRLK